MGGALNTEACLVLSEAVLKQAGLDYRHWYKILLDLPHNHSAQRELLELERFFCSEWFHILCCGHLNPETTIRDLRRAAEKEHLEKKKARIRKETKK